jgi:hypothetical protein
MPFCLPVVPAQHVQQVSALQGMQGAQVFEPSWVVCPCDSVAGLPNLLTHLPLSTLMRSRVPAASGTPRGDEPARTGAGIPSPAW